MNTEKTKIRLGLAIGCFILTAVALSACDEEPVPGNSLAGAIGAEVTDTSAPAPGIATSTAEFSPTDLPLESAAPSHTPTPPPTPTYTPLPPPGGRIAFVSDRDGNKEIYIMNPDGSGQTRLTYDPADDSQPAWAPDGMRIAFVSQRDGNDEIYIMNADGSNLTRLTNNPGRDGKPVWLPNGKWIVYESFRNCNTDLYLISADGQSEHRLTSDPAADTQPAVSADGSRLAFVSSRNGERADIYVLSIADALGSNAEISRRLTTSDQADTNPAWNPLDDSIAFTSCENERNSALYILNAEGTTNRRLTNDPYRHDFARWSPDGTRLAFMSDRDGNMEIYLVRPDGSNLVRLTANDAFDGHQVWSPESQHIAFASERDGNSEIYSVRIDGTELKRLTFNSNYDGEPAWSPR